MWIMCTWRVLVALFDAAPAIGSWWIPAALCDVFVTPTLRIVDLP
jgi:hypothetical protein